MVLWCFNVTVPDPVLLRCYQGSETTTNQKQGGLQSLLASPPLPPFGAVSLDLCLRARTCSEQFFCFVLFPCWPNRKASLEGGQPPYYDGEWA